MPRFREVLSGAMENAGEGLPEDFMDTVGSAYDEDIAELNGNASARIDELNRNLSEAEKALEYQKARNYDLLMAAPAPDNEKTAEEVEPENDGIDSMFE